MTTSRALAQELWRDWEEELAESTSEELNKKAQRLWKKSGFDLFLENAVKALIERAAPQCINTAIKISTNHLITLQDDLQLRRSAIAQDTEKIQGEIQSLNKDLKSLDDCRHRLREVDTIKSELNQKLTAILTEIKEVAKITLEDYFTKEQTERAEGLKKLDIKAREFFLTNMGNFELFPEWISKRFKSAFEFKSSGIPEFTTESEAKEFQNQAINYAQKRAENFLENLRYQIETQILESGRKLTQLLEQETQPIITRAQKHLNETFGVQLSLPKPNLNREKMSLIKPHITANYREIDQGYGEKVVEKRHWWHWLWIIPYQEVQTFKLPAKKENYYTVSMEELIIEINQSIEKGINSLNQGIITYLDDDFQQQIDDYFQNLEEYLNNYKDSLRQAENDHKLSLEEQQKLKTELQKLNLQVSFQLQETDKYLLFWQKLIAKIK
jgi:hypothetical protein